MHRHLALIPPTFRSFTPALSLRTISSSFEFLPYIVRYTLKHLQLFVPAELS